MSHDQPLTQGALTGVRVIDLADKSCVYATKVLADLGADVIRVEPVEGDPMRKVEPMVEATGESAFYAYMNAGKRAVALDLGSSEGRAMFADLVATAEIVVTSATPGSLDAAGIGYGELSADNPGLIWASISPFGSAGPHSGWLADDLISQAMGGLMTLSGLPEREPLRLYGEQSSFMAGLHAASGILMAYWSRMETGLGQHVDVSVQDCIAHTLESAVQVYTSNGIVRERQARSAEAGVGMFPCTDGEIFVYANIGMIASSWDNLVRWMRAENIPGAEDLVDEKWRDLTYRRTDEARRISAEVIRRLTVTRGKYEIYEQLQQRHILCAPMSQIGDLFNNQQLKFLDWFSSRPVHSQQATWPGPAFRLSETPRRHPGEVPAHAAHSEEVFAELQPRQTRPAGRKERAI